MYNTPNARRAALNKVSACHRPKCFVLFFSLETTCGAAKPSPRCVDASYRLRKNWFYHKRHLSDVHTKIQITALGSPSPLTHTLPASVRLTLEQTSVKNQTHDPRRAGPSASVLLECVWARPAPRQPLHLLEGRQAAHEATEGRAEASRYVMSGKMKKKKKVDLTKASEPGRGRKRRIPMEPPLNV